VCLDLVRWIVELVISLFHFIGQNKILHADGHCNGGVILPFST
jgi:hypothetical protein